jgi:hypothetical protein
VAWNYVKGTPLEKYFIEKTQKWYNWFSYNAVKEPGSSIYFLNRAVETRQQKGFVKTDTLENPSSARWTPQGEFIPEARAFALSREEYVSASKRQYEDMRSRYPGVAELRKGQFWAFSPYAFLHDQLVMWLPSNAAKKEAVVHLPYLQKDKFTEVRSDERNHTSHAFVRRPAYYTIFNSGTILTQQQRYGLGLIWNPLMGTVFQSQSKSDVAAWGTKVAGSAQVYEAGDIQPEFTVAGKSWMPAEGKNELNGEFRISYGLKTAGTKTVEFEPEKLKITVVHPGVFTEVIPLLVDKNAELTITNGTVELRQAKNKMTIRLSPAAKVKKLEEIITNGTDKQCQVIEISASDKLVYEFSFQ